MLSDGDLNTCLDLSDAPPIHMLKNEALHQRGFLVNVILPGSLEGHRQQMIKVMTSQDGNGASLEVTCLKECELTEDSLYSCPCDNVCQVFVRITTESISVQDHEMLAVCEIQATN